MAHPARLAPAGHLRNAAGHGDGVRRVVGLSPSATSYHLRALAGRDWWNPTPGRGDGRERLWRCHGWALRVSGVADLAPEDAKALHALLDVAAGLG